MAVALPIDSLGISCDQQMSFKLVPEVHALNLLLKKEFCSLIYQVFDIELNAF